MKLITSEIIVKNKFRNWHKLFGRSNAIGANLSETFPVSVHGSSTRVEIQFQDEQGKRIIMYLNNETATFLNNKLSSILITKK